MEINLIDKFKNLPDEIIHHIINYTDVVVYRDGKYINRLNKKDNRYNMILNIIRPIKMSYNKYVLNLILRKDRYSVIYSLVYYINDIITLHITISETGIDGFDRYVITKSFQRYIFDANSNWSQIIHYSI
jgi:hypothetical protein